MVLYNIYYIDFYKLLTNTNNLCNLYIYEGTYRFRNV